MRELTGDAIGPVDVITGGYPCQPFSLAGKRRGEDDDRHLWPEMYRIVAECRPAWIIGENVAEHINMGLDEVLSDLENAGYTCRTFVIPAVAVDAAHRRDRLWIVAHDTRIQPGRQEQRAERERIGASGKPKSSADSEGQPIRPGLRAEGPGGERGGRPSDGGGEDVADAGIGRHWPSQEEIRSGRDAAIDGSRDVADTGRNTTGGNPKLHGEEAQWSQGKFQPTNGGQDVANADRPGCLEHRGGKPAQTQHPAAQHSRDVPDDGRGSGEGPGTGERGPAQPSRWLPQPGVGGMADGVPRWLDEPDCGRVATGVKNRVARLKSLGNAVVPPIITIIGQAILEAENE